MPFIPRPATQPARRRLTCSVPEATATLLKRYCEFMPCTREYTIVHFLDEGCRRDKEFQAWLAKNYPEARATVGDPVVPQVDASRPTPAPVAAPPVQPPASSLQPPSSSSSLQPPANTARS
jgi:hypothetical protein